MLQASTDRSACHARQGMCALGAQHPLHRRRLHSIVDTHVQLVCAMHAFCKKRLSFILLITLECLPSYTTPMLDSIHAALLNCLGLIFFFARVVHPVTYGYIVTGCIHKYSSTDCECSFSMLSCRLFLPCVILCGASMPSHNIQSSVSTVLQCILSYLSCKLIR